ncbi:MAG: flagellin FliC [Proteobacteria bacterium]|nr:flagellin FliC [Pseudomonadota bacterium]
MALRINYNFESISAQRNLSQTQSSFFKAIEQLSSGMRINKAADDAAGLAVSEKLKNQVRGLNQAQRNAQDAISLMQVAEGALNETHNLLARMRELSIQSANDTLTDPDRKHLQAEMDQLLAEVDRIASSSQFNGKSLLVGTSASQTSLVFHIGANTGDEVSVSLSALDARAVGLSVSALGSSGYATTLGQLSSLSFQTSANAAIGTLDTAIESVSKSRALLGAVQNRMNSAVASLGVSAENTGAANSRIRDADVAQSVSEMVRTQILQQSTMAVLAPA